ncbi:MAG: type II and III secretion system protein family protein [Acidobacteriaceae bacterium]
MTAACSGAAAQAKAVAAAAQTPFTGSMGTSAQVVGEPLHLLVGRSMFVNTDNRIRRVYVSNPDVLDSFTSSPHQIVVTSKAPGVSSLVLWDETGQSRAYLINSDIDVNDLHHALHDAFPAENIGVEGHGDQVALTGTVSSQETSDAAAKLATLFSKDVANSLLVGTKHTPQVRLKVRVIEIDRSRAEQLGFNFFGPGANTFNTTTGQFGAVTVGPGATSGTTTAGSSLLAVSSLLGLFYYNQDLQLGAAIQALENKQIAQILAEPTITALSGEKASFLSGGEFPYPVVQGGTGGFTSVTIQFRPYGVKLDFTPNVLADGTISLKVAPEVSALDYSNEVTISGYTIPAISTRRAETQIELRSGQSFAISGLLDNRTTDQLEKIPGIGDIPILGKLFQSKSVSKSVAELAVIVTPTIVDPLTDNPVPTQPKTAEPLIDNPKFDKGITPKTPPPQPAPQPVPQQVPIQ